MAEADCMLLAKYLNSKSVCLLPCLSLIHAFLGWGCNPGALLYASLIQTQDAVYSCHSRRELEVEIVVVRLELSGKAS